MLEGVERSYVYKCSPFTIYHYASLQNHTEGIQHLRLKGGKNCEKATFEMGYGDVVLHQDKQLYQHPCDSFSLCYLLLGPDGELDWPANVSAFQIEVWIEVLLGCDGCGVGSRSVLQSQVLQMQLRFYYKTSNTKQKLQRKKDFLASTPKNSLLAILTMDESSVILKQYGLIRI